MSAFGLIMSALPPAADVSMASAGLPLMTQRRSLQYWGGRARVADHVEREAGQDRRQSGPARSVCQVPIGRRRRAPEPVSGNPAAGP